MKTGTRIFIFVLMALLVAFFGYIGSFFEANILSFTREISSHNSFLPVSAFYAVVSANIVLLFLFLFLTFRNGVMLAVDSKNGVFGSKLRTRLVTSFLFFSLLPTAVLLYISTKFVNANFEKWLPESLVATSQKSLNSEGEYQRKILDLLAESKPPATGLGAFDFVLKKQHNSGAASIQLRNLDKKVAERIQRVINEHKTQISGSPVWFFLDRETRVALRRDDSGDIFGIISPPMIHPQWEVLSNELSFNQSDVRIFRISYYVMLGVVTLLILFSATWLGFTMARELTTPLQILASATELVAQGSYAVKIDDIVSDDEIGRLALSFRSMVFDLRNAKDEADKAAAEIQRKADELAEKSEYNEVLLRNVNAAVIAVDCNARIESWNHQAEQLFLCSEREALRKKLEEVLPQELHERAVQPLFNDLRDSGKTRATHEFAGRIGKNDFQLQFMLTELQTPEGEKAYILFANDVTELAKAQRIAAWREVARRIAHEIKNPLTPIRLGAQRLQKRFAAQFSGDDASVFSESIAVITHSVESIKRLVDEFIRIARMPNAVLREGNILESVRIAVAGFRENTEGVAIELRCVDSDTGEDLAGSQHVVAYFDEDHIVRLLGNLISNAIAASVGLSDRVDVRCEVSKSQKVFAVKVIDAGAGVPEEVRSKIFEPYFSTKRTGTGLGLVIVRQIVEEHHGSIAVTANAPRGTIFAVELPLVS